MDKKIKGEAKTSASWVRLIHKIFEGDPLLCLNCGKAMKNIARQALLFITNHQEVKKMLKHIGAECRPEEPKGLLHPPLLQAMRRRTPMNGETSHRMKLIFVMRNGAFKPQGAPCLKSGFFKPA